MCEFAQGLVALPSVLLFGAAIPKGDVIVEIPTDDRIMSQFKKRCLLASEFHLPVKFLLREPTPGNVADHCQYQRLIPKMQGTQHDIDRKLASILAPPIEIESGSHGARAGLLRIVISVLRMAGAKALGQEKFNWLAKQFLTRIAKDSLGLLIRPHDNAGAIGDQHGVRRKVE